MDKWQAANTACLRSDAIRAELRLQAWLGRLYDLSEPTNAGIKEALIRYWLLKTLRTEGTHVCLIIAESAWPLLISWKRASREGKGKEFSFLSWRLVFRRHTASARYRQFHAYASPLPALGRRKKFQSSLSSTVATDATLLSLSFEDEIQPMSPCGGLPQT